MKKFMIGALSLGLVAAAGVTSVQAVSGQMEMPAEENEHMMEMSEMHQEMIDSNGEMNFGQVKKFMSDMHPEWSNEDMKQMYQSVHGTNGAAPSKNFEHMHMNK
ncbi:hypothetical protein GCM10010954_28600 [Halobacillus andaensis]|uniref:Uncharacterized protein n=1 Tax=Halobacillus andaensis TaxID=1176239 RepID=A0A917EX62_HALAA|nr:hypothetical protein [Halobacillus andaensis]MBP2006492.1 hypothetical protein [Halobacillus andaensis]GGF27763.1 hypothetical protein GCM10010954_28600 [Halobacillus andaensis]